MQNRQHTFCIVMASTVCGNDMVADNQLPINFLQLPIYFYESHDERWYQNVLVSL